MESDFERSLEISKSKKYLNIPNIKFLKSNHYCRISILEIHDNHLNSLRI